MRALGPPRMLDLAILGIGAALLYVGARWLVQGASGLSRAVGVSERAVGVSVVAIATSAPEFAVSLVAASSNHSPIVLGSVVGSNIANIGLVLGLSILIAPPRVDGSLFRREVPYLLIATLAAGPVLLNGHIDRAEGALFFVSAAAFIAVALHWAKARRVQDGDRGSAIVPETEHEPKRSTALLVSWLLLGILALVAGGRFSVAGAVGVARDLGVGERLIALTVLGVGTALPELVTALVAAKRGHAELAVGTVVGSNLLNLLLVLGFTTLLLPVHAKLIDVRFELVVMTVLSFALGMSLYKARTLSRTEGALYLGSYAVFVGWLVSHA